MKYFKWLLAGLSVLILTLVLLAGCGVSKSDYEALQAEKTALETEKTALQAEKQTLQNDYDLLTTEHEALQTEKSTLEAEKQNLTADYGQLNTQHETLQTELNALQEEKESLQTDYSALDSELTEIKKVYPPRDFSSRRELEEWLYANDVSEKPTTTDAETWIGRALEIQEDALADGYIISVDYDGPDEEFMYTVYCTTIIDGNILFWDPETDDIYQDTNLLPIK